MTQPSALDAPPAMTPDSDVQCEIMGRAGVITLARPKALNALTHAMVRTIAGQLRVWAVEPRVRHVVIRQTGDKAFSAGGDIRKLAEDMRAGRFDTIDAFYRDEYRLNRQIRTFPKPYVALIDGIVMGGGVGVAIHGSHRVVSEHLVFAMPEVGIGFFPDVGATFFLPRMPGRTGLYLALTGARIGAADALWGGLATHHVPRAAFEPLFRALIVATDVTATLRLFAQPVGTSDLERRRPVLDRLLAAPTLEGLIEGLAAAAATGDAEARALWDVLGTRSPTSVALAFEQMRRGATLAFDDCMRLEYRIVSRIVRGPDFPEGVRAALIDRDHAPVWSPSDLKGLDPERLAQHVAPLAQGDLSFP